MPAPDIVPKMIGFNVTDPATVPVTTKAADPMLHVSSSFLQYP